MQENPKNRKKKFCEDKALEKRKKIEITAWLLLPLSSTNKSLKSVEYFNIYFDVEIAVGRNESNRSLSAKAAYTIVTASGNTGLFMCTPKLSFPQNSSICGESASLLFYKLRCAFNYAC